MALIRNLFKSISWEEARRLLRVVAAPIIEVGRARIAVPGRLLHVLELGAVLERRGVVNDGITLLYRGSTKDCAPCPLKARCCPNTPVRKIPRSIY